MPTLKAHLQEEHNRFSKQSKARGTKRKVEDSQLGADETQGPKRAKEPTEHATRHLSE